MNKLGRVDKKLEKLGFTKISDDKHEVAYARYNQTYNYTQEVAILHKSSGNHILQSTDNALFDTKHIGNTCVGLTYEEMYWFTKKMKKVIKKWDKKEK